MVYSITTRLLFSGVEMQKCLLLSPKAFFGISNCKASILQVNESEIYGQKPVDDVYLENLYKQEPKSLKTTIEKLKKITKLDFIDENALIYLKLGLDVDPTRKKQRVNVYKAIERPYKFGHQNKVVLFTADKDTAELSLTKGAYAAGNADTISKILAGRVNGDAYIATKDMEKILKKQDLLKKRLGKLFPGTINSNVTDDYIPLLKTYLENAIVSNIEIHQEVKVVIAQLKQPSEEIEENIKVVMEEIEDMRKNKQLIIASSISCFSSYLPFSVNQETPV